MSEQREIGPSRLRFGLEVSGMTHFKAVTKQAHRFLCLSLIPLLLNLTSCALLINGTGQMVPVNSSPVGVEVRAIAKS